MAGSVGAVGIRGISFFVGFRGTPNVRKLASGHASLVWLPDLAQQALLVVHGIKAVGGDPFALRDETMASSDMAKKPFSKTRNSTISDGQTIGLLFHPRSVMCPGSSLCEIGGGRTLPPWRRAVFQRPWQAARAPRSARVDPFSDNRP